MGKPSHLTPTQGLLNSIFIFQLCFLAKLRPLGYQKFNLVANQDSKAQKSTIFGQNLAANSNFEFKNLDQNDIVMKNEFLTAKFDSKVGYLKSVQEFDGVERKVELGFVQYGVRRKNQSEIFYVLSPIEVLQNLFDARQNRTWSMSVILNSLKAHQTTTPRW